MAGDQKMYGNPTYQPTESAGGRGQSYSLGELKGVSAYYCGMYLYVSDFVACESQRHRPACAYAQTGHCLCYSLPEK